MRHKLGFDLFPRNNYLLHSILIASQNYRETLRNKFFNAIEIWYYVGAVCGGLKMKYKILPNNVL